MLHLLLFVFALLNSGDPQPASPAAHFHVFDTTPVNRKLLLEMVNDARRKGRTCGDAYFAPAPPLEWDASLEAAATAHSSDMAAKNYFSHISPDGSSAGSRIQDAGYNWKNYGENIGMGYRNEQEVMNGWLHSAGHCKNIMNKAYKQMGIGRAGNYWTQDFGSK